jgi:hypothetical protein
MNGTKNYGMIMTLLLLMAVVAGCGQKTGTPKQREESSAAKALLQGVWSDEESETLVFKMEGDSVYYPDFTSMPAYFWVYGDTLYIGSSARYHIEKHTEHLLWFTNNDGELVKLVKDDGEADKEAFNNNQTQILSLTDVLKKDTVVSYEGERYHIYIAVNPTKYKVSRQTINDDGLEVENVYYDNIIHLSIFKGNQQLFSRDFRKKQYEQRLPAQFFGQAVLNNMEYDKIDANGFHMNASLCSPGDAICYLLEHVISFDGKLSTQLLEY